MKFNLDFLNTAPESVELAFVACLLVSLIAGIALGVRTGSGVVASVWAVILAAGTVALFSNIYIQ